MKKHVFISVVLLVLFACVSAVQAGGSCLENKKSCVSTSRDDLTKPAQIKMVAVYPTEANPDLGGDKTVQTIEFKVNNEYNQATAYSGTYTANYVGQWITIGKLQGLKPNGKYTVKARMAYAKGRSQWSDASMVYTGPSKVKRVRTPAAKIHKKSVLVKWKLTKRQDKAQLYFRVVVRKASNGKKVKTKIVFDQARAKISGLRSKTKYKVRVKAHNTTNGHGKVSKAKFFTTK